MRARTIALIALVAIATIAIACGSAANVDERDEAPADETGRGVLGGTDTDMRSVRLADVHFDTFDGRSVPLSEIDEGTLLSLRARIRFEAC